MGSPTSPSFPQPDGLKESGPSDSNDASRSTQTRQANDDTVVTDDAPDNDTSSAQGFSEIPPDQPPPPAQDASASPTKSQDTQIKVGESSKQQSSSNNGLESSLRGSTTTRGASIGTNPLESVDSTAQLLPGKQKGNNNSSKNKGSETAGKGILARVAGTRSHSHIETLQTQPTMAETTEAPVTSKRAHIQFDLSNAASRSAILLRAKISGNELGDRVKSVLKRQYSDGVILKMEKMLVRVDASAQKKIPDDYDENTSQGVDSMTKQKWREYMIVCRESRKGEESEYVLQAYKSRVIPASTEAQSKKPEFELALQRKHLRLNMYSSLDKTIVIWDSGIRGTQIYILQARSASSSVEWLTLLRGLLGYGRPSELNVSVPELAVNLRLQDPFSTTPSDTDSESEDEERLMASFASREEAVAPTLVKRCLDMLKSSPEIEETVDLWKHGHRVGLAWKRYDRLEWVHGAQEKKMFGTFAMTNTHDLELRPKHHYPTTSHTPKGKTLTEPPPVEGFLIQLTSKKGGHKRMGRFFFKRLYFSTYDHFLVFTQPKNAEPPTPPNHHTWDNKMTSQQISDEIPMIYAVNPYPVENDRILWLHHNRQQAQDSDEQAVNEAKRNISMLKNCEGFIDLFDVVKVRKVHRDMEEVKVQLDKDEESDSEAEAEETDQDEGSISNIDDSQTFELLLKNGLVVRLRAYDKQTKSEWKHRLRELVKYWRWRHTQDIHLLHEIRAQNLRELQVDEEGEAWVGMFARKWELSTTHASPDLYNMCGISCCRSIAMSGPLYTKPRLHGTFTLSHCILIPGHLLLFESALRTSSGKAIPHIQHNKTRILDLSECYLYTGLLTEGDLLYHNRTFDANAPGHHALPRMWPEDGWDNWDEDVMTCFVLWRPAGKSWFREAGEGKRGTLKRVSALGKKGNRVVVRARSRAERDRWVLAIAGEIERCGGGSEVRIVDK